MRFVLACMMLLVAACSDSDQSIPSFAVGTFQDPAAFDDVLAEAMGQAADDQRVVIVDFDGCPVTRVRALPRPDHLLVTIPSSESGCDAPVARRALFVVDTQGTNSAGDWDYSAATPAIRFGGG